MEQLLERINKAPNQLKFGVMAGVVIAMTAANYFLMIDPAEQEILSYRGQQVALEIPWTRSVLLPPSSLASMTGHASSHRL